MSFTEIQSVSSKYDKLNSVDELKPYLIPYRKVTRVKDIHTLLINIHQLL